jgi:hypothetical protein
MGRVKSCKMTVKEREDRRHTEGQKNRRGPSACRGRIWRSAGQGGRSRGVGWECVTGGGKGAPQRGGVVAAGAR